MSKFALSFSTGLLQGGLNGYQMRRNFDRQDKLDAQRAKEDELRLAALQRQDTRDKATDAALSDYQDMQKTGKVVDSNTSGFSDASAGMLASQGGQQAVDSAASSANLEAVRMGMQPTNTTSVGTSQPTVTMRDATQADRMGALARIAGAKGDYATMGTLDQKAADQKLAKQDLDYGAKIVSDPNGKEAQELIGLMGKQQIGGINVRTDPKTGLSFVDMTGSDGQPKTVELSGTNLMSLAVAKRKLERGDVSGLQDLAAIDKGIAAAAVASWKVRGEVARLNNDAVGKGATITNQAIRTGLAINKDGREASEAARAAADTQAQREAGAAAAKAAGWSEAQVEAVRAGAIRPPGALKDGNAPSEVKLAEALMASGLAKNQADALKMAMQSKAKSPEAVRQDVFGKALAANFGDAKKAQEATDAAMTYLFSAQGGQQAPGAAAVSGAMGMPKVGQIVNGYAYKGGDPKDKNNWAPASAGIVQ